MDPFSGRPDDDRRSSADPRGDEARSEEGGDTPPVERWRPPERWAAERARALEADLARAREEDRRRQLERRATETTRPSEPSRPESSRTADTPRPQARDDDDQPTQAWKPGSSDPSWAPARPTPAPDRWNGATTRSDAGTGTDVGRPVAPDRSSSLPAAHTRAEDETTVVGATPAGASRSSTAPAPAAEEQDPLARKPLESRAAYERRLADITAREEPTADAVAVATGKRGRKTRLAIRKLNPWSVLRFSLVFYFCMLLIMLLGTALVFGTMKAFGVIDNVEEVLRNLQIPVEINGGWIFRWLFLVGLAGTAVMSAVTVFMSFLYNLIADVVGGIEILVSEREQS